MTRLVVVRHGNTFETGETPRRIGARTDLPLTATGLEQARALGRHFAEAGIRFSRALSSSLLRTRATAEAILAEQAAPPEIEAAAFLTEIDHGPDEDQAEDAVLARVGNDAITLWDTECIAPPGWEVGAQWRMPAWRVFADEAAAGPAGDTILLVTSNGAARFGLLALGIKPGEKANTVKLRTGSYGLIELGAGQFRLSGWNIRPGDRPGIRELLG